MSKDTCPSCVHSKGFNCPVCWPVQPLEFKGHSWLRVTGDAHTPERFWVYRLLTETEYAALDGNTRKDYRRITDNDLPRLAAKFRMDQSMPSMYTTTERTDALALDIVMGKNPLIIFSETYAVRQSLCNMGKMDNGRLNCPNITLRFQVHHGSEICQHTHYAGDISCNIQVIASVLPANYFEQLQKEKYEQAAP